jgi:hypothetical protein
MKIRPVGEELFHADGQTDKTKLNTVVAFRNFANAPRNTVITSQVKIMCGKNTLQYCVCTVQ